MADRKAPKNIVGLIEGWAKTVEPIEGGGTVQKNARPDAWAYLIGLAWLLVGVTFGVIVSAASGDEVWASIFALAAAASGILGVVAHYKR